MSRIFLGVLLWWVATQTMAQALPPSESLFQNPFTHSVSLEKDFWVEICSKPKVKEKCKISVVASGIGAREIETYQRHSNGLVSLIFTNKISVSGKALFGLSFESPGSYNLVFLVRSPSGKILAIDGAIFSVVQDTPFFRIDPSLSSGDASESVESDDNHYYLDD